MKKSIDTYAQTAMITPSKTQEDKKMTHTQEFKDFILALQAWVEDGCPQGKPFQKEDSICFQAYHLFEDWVIDEIIKTELENEFRQTYGESYYTPFNNGRDDYGREMVDPEWGHYKNPDRIEWIKGMADKLKEEENK